VLLLCGLERADCHDAIAAFPYPTIALLRNGASDAAFLAAALCDLMVCSEEASYGYAHPTPAEAMLLNERFGERLAHDFLLSGSVTGRELRAKGWTCPILPAEQVEAHARKLAATLAAKSAKTLRVVKRHFARSIAPLVNTLTVAESTAPEAAVVRVVEAKDLAEALQSGCNALVLTGAMEEMPATELPIVATLSGKVTGRAWMNALLCDACVYGNDVVISSEGIPESAAPLFAARLGNDAAVEVLLTQTEYSIADLHQRVGTLTIADDVVAAAIHVAERLATIPAATRAAWKKQLAPAEPIAENEETYESIAAPTTIALRTNVVTATAHPHGVIVLKMEERQAKNAFSDALIEGLTEAFNHIEKSPAYKVVVLTGHDQCFSSGGTKEILLAVQQGRMKFTDINVWELPLDCKLPVIAALQGHGIGGGWALGMFADLALLSEDSRYWNPYVEYGFAPGDGATWVFPQTLGRDLGIESMLTAQHYTGAELRARGMRQRIAPRAEIVPAAMELATQIARMPRTRLMEIKRQLTAHIHDVLAETYRLELAMHDETIVGHADTLARIESTYYEGSEKPAASQERATARTVDSNNLAAIAAGMKALLASELQLREADIDDDTQFVEMGLDSISGVTWVRKINAKYRTSIAATAIYSYPTLTLFSRYVAEEAMTEEAPVAQNIEIASEDVAAIAAGMKALLASELQLREADIDDDAQFVDLGLDSISGVTWIRKINAKYGTSIAATSIYSYPTLTQLSRYVAEEAPDLPTPAAQPKSAAKTLTRRQRSRFAAAAMPAPQSQAIAVIGMAGQFAKATNLEQFWRNIAEGRDCIEPIPHQRWDADEHYRAGTITPGKTISRWMGGLEHYDRFDPLFFNISPTEAESIDPQQRLFLEACWHSIENAGYDARRLSGSKCGVFVGCAFGDYHLLSRAQQLSAESFTGDAASILAARVSYLLNLRGPSLAIDTA
ncbi:MAG: enoyl-CoA hydratase/isomerase family protein, partial [Acidobacteria bacterium]|nr:enoyl-CoA hydratase/isomerase family protein [Acidobacteriota bacterium]